MPRLCKSKINFLLEKISSKEIERYGRIQWYIFGLCNSIGRNLLGFLTYPKHESVDFLADILIRKTTAALAQLQQQIQENYIFLLCLKRVSLYVCTALVIVAEMKTVCNYISLCTIIFLFHLAMGVRVTHFNLIALRTLHFPRGNNLEIITFLATV